jgi:transcriptional regulator with XRE-family HTH domain
MAQAGNTQGLVVANILALIHKKRCRVADVMSAAGLNRGMLSAWRTGQRRITEDSLAKIAKVLDTTAAELRGQPLGLTVAQAQLMRRYVAGIGSMQQAMLHALQHPQWAEEEWERECTLGKLDEQRSEPPDAPPEE